MWTLTLWIPDLYSCCSLVDDWYGERMNSAAADDVATHHPLGRRAGCRITGRMEKKAHWERGREPYDGSRPPVDPRPWVRGDRTAGKRVQTS